MFICRYHFDEALRRASLLRQQLTVGGGPLGVFQSKLLELEVDEQGMQLWQELLKPREMWTHKHGQMVNVGSGPALVFSLVDERLPGSTHLRRVVWSVQNAERAEHALKQFGLFGGHVAV